MLFVEKQKSAYEKMTSVVCVFFFFFQAEDGIRGSVASRGLGDVYRRRVG